MYRSVRRCFMRGNRWAGICVCIAGAGLILTANYINQRVAEGKEQIREGEQKVSAGKILFSLTPYTKEIGQKAIFDSADSKIQAGKEEIAQYKGGAKQLQVGGVLLIVAGLGLFFIFGKKS